MYCPEEILSVSRQLPRLLFTNIVVRAPDYRGVESHIVQRWAANLAIPLILAVRIAEQDTL